MADEAPQSVDLWSVLDDADETVKQWPSWQQRYDADLYYEENAESPGGPAPD